MTIPAGWKLVPIELSEKHFQDAYRVACGNETATTMAPLTLWQAQKFHAAMLFTSLSPPEEKN